MTNQEILTKAIQKAIDGGYEDLVSQGVEILGLDEFGEYLKVKGKLQGYYDVPIYQLIYNHDFAKALWGEYETHAIKSNGRRYNVIVNNKGWNHHLRMMVIADDPIKYLGENI